MIWVLAAGVAWLAVALVAGVFVGRGIRLADRKAGDSAPPPNFVVDPLTSGPTGTPAEPPAPRPPTEQTTNRQHGLA